MRQIILIKLFAGFRHHGIRTFAVKYGGIRRCNVVLPEALVPQMLVWPSRASSMMPSRWPWIMIMRSKCGMGGWY